MEGWTARWAAVPTSSKRESLWGSYHSAKASGISVCLSLTHTHTHTGGKDPRNSAGQHRSDAFADTTTWKDLGLVWPGLHGWRSRELTVGPMGVSGKRLQAFSSRLKRSQPV